MALQWEQVVVDSADPVALGRWWAEALGWVVLNDSAEEFEIRPEPDRLPGLIFGPVPEGKTVKNRLTSTSAPTTRTPRSPAFSRSARTTPTSGRAATSRG